jgi:hypothetical protein
MLPFFNIRQGERTMKSKLVSMLVCIALLSGCVTKSAYYQSQTHFGNFEDVSTLVLRLETDQEKICLVDSRPDPSERLAAGQAASVAAVSSIQSTPLPPDASPGAAAAGAAIGMVIGMQIIKVSQDAKEQSAANKKAEPILEHFTKDRLADMLNSNILKEAKTQGKITLVESSSAALNSLLVEPELHFNSDLSRIEIKLNATIQDGKSQEVLYRNTFEYWSKPTGIVNECDQNCALWTAEKGHLLTAYLAEGSQEVMAMLLYDIEASIQQDQSAAQPQRTHRITSDRGTVFLRGTAVKVGEGRVWVKDLRGNIRSIYGQLGAGSGRTGNG